MSIGTVDRHHYLLRALAGYKNGRTADDLHRELEEGLGVRVSIRTIYRDLDVLSRHFPITEEVKNHKTYYFMLDHFKLESIQCSFDEIMALAFMNRLLESLGSDPVVDAGKRLTGRLVAGLPELQQRYLEDVSRHFYVELPGSDSRGAQIIQTFIDSIRLHREVKIRYHAFNSDEVSQRIIHPYTIYFRQQYYIVAWCTVRNSIREFRLDRILEAQVLETEFSLQPDFKYENYSSRCWDALKGDEDYWVVLRFRPQGSRFIMEYHGDRADELKELPDGSLEFCKRVSTLDEIFPWILSHGAGVEVIAPQELREMLEESIRVQAEKIGLI